MCALRRERFGPDQAVLLTHGRLQHDEFELAGETRRTESYLAHWVDTATELAIGALLWGVICWLAGLFYFGPAVGPLWQSILIIGGIDLFSGAVVAALDIWRWRREQPPCPGIAAVALRLHGSEAAERLARVQRVLELFGAQREVG